jgi:tRNA-dihydrouridine synthase B
MGVRHARKHLAAYVDGAGPGALPAADRTRLLTTGDPGVALALLRRAFLEPACSTVDGSAASIGEAA